MKILILTTGYPDNAGNYNGVFVHCLARALARRGHSLRVIVPARNDHVGATEVDGVPVVRFRYALGRRGHVLTSLDGGIPEALKRSRRAVLQVPAMLAGFAAAAVAHAGWADVIHANWLGAGIAGSAAHLLAGTPMVMTLRGDDAYNIHAGGLWRAVGKCVFYQCAAVTAVSANMPPLVERYIPRRCRPVLVPTFGVDADMFHPAGEHDRRGAGALSEQERGVPPSTGAKRRLWVPDGQGRRAPTSSASLRSAPLEGATRPRSRQNRSSTPRTCTFATRTVLSALCTDARSASTGAATAEWGSSSSSASSARKNRSRDTIASSVRPSRDSAIDRSECCTESPTSSAPASTATPTATPSSTHRCVRR